MEMNRFESLSELISAHHRAFEEFLLKCAREEASSASPADPAGFFEEFSRVVSAHEEAEQAVLFPELMAFEPTAKRGVLEWMEDHHVSDLLIQEILMLDRDDPKWAAKVSVLRMLFERHFYEEETRALPILRRIEESDALLARKLLSRWKNFFAHASGKKAPEPPYEPPYASADISRTIEETHASISS